MVDIGKVPGHCLTCFGEGHLWASGITDRDPSARFQIICCECGEKTPVFKTRAAAIQAWYDEIYMNDWE